MACAVWRSWRWAAALISRSARHARWMRAAVPPKARKSRRRRLGRPRQPNTRSRRCPMRERNRRARLGRSRALGQGIAGRCARSTRERCDDGSAELHSAPITAPALFRTLLGGVDRPAVTMSRAPIRNCRASDSGRRRSVDRVVALDPLRDFLGVWRLVGNRDGLRDRCRVPAVSRFCDLHARDLLERFREFRLHAFQRRARRRSAIALLAVGRQQYLHVA